MIRPRIQLTAERLSNIQRNCVCQRPQPRHSHGDQWRPPCPTPSLAPRSAHCSRIPASSSSDSCPHRDRSRRPVPVTPAPVRSLFRPASQMNIRHILGLERRHTHSCPQVQAAQSGRDQTLADIRPRAQDRQRSCPHALRSCQDHSVSNTKFTPSDLGPKYRRTSRELA
jgi:hypothetical protein